MYFFVGKMMVLQPDKEHRFIAKDEPYHDMLPAQPGLWVLRQPNVAALSKKAAPSLAAMANGELADAGHAAIQVASKSNGSHAQTKGSHKGKLSKPSTAVMVVSHTRKGKPAASLRDALMDLMNYPHPLDTLGEPSAYGPDGAISRYHNPDHYVRALGGVLRTKTKPMRMGFKSSRWYLHLQEKEQAMKRKVRSMRHAGSESARKQKRQLQMQLQKQHNQQKCQPPPSVLNEWKRASQHLG